MAKLNKRQIIILALAALAVLYAAYELLIAGPAGKKAASVVDSANMDTLVSNLQKDLTKNIIAGTDVYIIAKAEAGWQKNPFWEKSAFKEWAAKDAPVSPSETRIVYSGYVDSGRRRLAVINGCEYREGEQLEMEGFFLKKIMPFHILVVNKNTGSEIEVPIQE